MQEILWLKPEQPAVQGIPKPLRAAQCCPTPGKDSGFVFKLYQTKVRFYHPVAAPEVVPEDVAEQVDRACHQSGQQAILPEHMELRKLDIIPEQTKAEGQLRIIP